MLLPPFWFIYVIRSICHAPPAEGNQKALVLLATRSWDFHPGVLTPLRSLGSTAHGWLIPLQRSACDYAEVSLSLCICHRLPRGATPILTHPLYRSLPKEVIARSESTWLGILTPIQGTYLLVCLFSCLGPVKDNPIPFLGSGLFVPSPIRNGRGQKVTLRAKKVEKRLQLLAFFNNWGLFQGVFYINGTVWMIPKPRERWHFGPIIVTHVISTDDRIELGIWVRTNK